MKEAAFLINGIVFGNDFPSRIDCGDYGGQTSFADVGIPALRAMYQISRDYILVQDYTWQLENKSKTNRD